MTDIDRLLDDLTLSEKEALVNGDSMWTTAGVPRLGIPPLRVTDGPAGARGSGFLDSGTPTLCIPCGAALGATWNTDLVRSLGEALGDETRAKGAHVLLGPTINLHRHPLGGRNFECFSEDPLLTGRLAAAYVHGVQSRGVATTPKHFVANDAEFERNTINAVVDARTLRELYLLPFELVCRAPDGAWGVMSAYNRLNGTFCSENPWLLTEVLRDEWGFDGMVVTDWFAARSTAATATSGCDLEMPGPGAHFGDGQLVAAVESGEVAAEHLDAMCRRLLTLLARTGAFDRPVTDDEQTIDTPEQRALARQAAAEAIVLLRNEAAAVPVDLSSLRRVAVLGPNAGRAQIMGGGSAALRAYHYRTPLAELAERLGPQVEVVHGRGCDTDRTAPPVAGPMEVTYYAADDRDGAAMHAETVGKAKLIVLGLRPPIPLDWDARATVSFIAETAGEHQLSLIGIGTTRVLRDGAVVVETNADTPRGDNFFGLGTVDVIVPLVLAAGETVDLVIETGGRMGFGGFQLGLLGPVDPNLMDDAVALAADADAAIVVVGTNDDWETEGRDRDSMSLPGRQDELVARVAEVSPHTIVVVNAGSPTAMPWVDDVSAVVQCWFGGQEMAAALADVLLGETDPAGRLPTTFPLEVRHAPSHVNFPGENSEVRYGEGVFMGYRGYEATDRPVRFPFGHGLSTTTFDVGVPVPDRRVVPAGDPVRITVPVTNTGDRRGAHVVQCYVSQDRPRVARPPKELAAFAKVWLDPGDHQDVVLELDETAFRYFDPGDVHFSNLSSGAPVPSGGGADRSSLTGWLVDPGSYTVHIGRSSATIDHTLSVELTDPGL